jgi:hypothetical protein
VRSVIPRAVATREHHQLAAAARRASVALPGPPGYRRTKADIHKGYLDMPSTPLLPFGHGLSCTTFEYSPLKRESVDVGGELRASLKTRSVGGEDRAFLSVATVG